jgi:hypothetical protein
LTGAFLAVVERLSSHVLHRTFVRMTLSTRLGLSINGSRSRLSIFGWAFRSRWLYPRDCHPSLVLFILELQLLLSQQRVDLAVSEDANLLICECTLHAVRVVSQVFVCELGLCGLVILWEGGLRFAWEVLRVEGFEIILIEDMSVEHRILGSLRD